MADLDHLESNGDKENDTKDKEGASADEDELTHFCIESEEVLADEEREQWHEDAEKYEAIIDQLFDEDTPRNDAPPDSAKT